MELKLFAVFTGSDRWFVGICSTQAKAQQVVAHCKKLSPRRQAYWEEVAVDARNKYIDDLEHEKATCAVENCARCKEL